MDPRILKKFVKTAGNLTNRYVIEVGPGPGGITRALLNAGAKQVHVIEKDPRFLPSLKLIQEAAGENKLHITIGDCLHYNPADAFSKSLAMPWNNPDEPQLILVGNLPFNVATPLLIRLLGSMHDRSNIYSFGRIPAILTFQHEVALRMAAPPGDLERSRLSVVTQNYTEVDYIFNLPGGAFVPPPEVEVGIVKLTPLTEPYITGLPFSFINKVVTAIFSGKQKQLKNSISINLFPKKREVMAQKLLDMACVPFDQIAINLTMDEIGSICHAYKHICDEENDRLNGIKELENYEGPPLSKIHDEDKEKKRCHLSSSSTSHPLDKSEIQFDIRL